MKEPLGHKSHELLHTKYVQRGTEMPHNVAEEVYNDPRHPAK